MLVTVPLRLTPRIGTWIRLTRCLLIMPTLRSATKASAVPILSKKRNATESVTPKPKRSKAPKKLATTADTAEGPATGESVLLVPQELTTGNSTKLIPAKLSFSFAEAKAHLINADPRFSELFERLKCKPFEELEMVDPFKYAY